MAMLFPILDCYHVHHTIIELFLYVLTAEMGMNGVSREKLEVRILIHIELKMRQHQTLQTALSFTFGRQSHSQSIPWNILIAKSNDPITNSIERNDQKGEKKARERGANT